MAQLLMRGRLTPQFLCVLSCIMVGGAPRRELLLWAPRARGDLLDAVARVVSSSGLDLVQRPDCTASVGVARLYDQRNVGMSRKQLVPIVLDGIAKL